MGPPIGAAIGSLQNHNILWYTSSKDTTYHLCQDPNLRLIFTTEANIYYTKKTQRLQARQKSLFESQYKCT